MNKVFCFSLLLLLSLAGFGQASPHDLHFDTLAKNWDEAIPLGNGMIGALVWQKGDNLRLSLDRADLWDLRPMKGLHRKEFRYQWIREQVMKKDYKPVQQYFDEPYDREPAPTKIPGGALEFSMNDWGTVQSVHLDIQRALCEVKWANGITLTTFVHATDAAGWFRFTNVPAHFTPELVAPRYQGEIKTSGDPVGGDDLSRLGYKNGTIAKVGQTIVYSQEGWNGFRYEISVRWKKTGKTIDGVWSISSHYPDKKTSRHAAAVTQNSLQNGYDSELSSHIAWWKNFWSKSAIHVPDPLIEKQWYLEQYKFGSASRRGAPPISLQAVWTADNGRIPPWKGDYHHDLNTQLSYWPAYSGNHLEEALAYLDHLNDNKNNYRRYTRLFFETNGLAVPGVTTLDGTEMGGWIQYSLSPTVSSWLSQHFYLQWRYSMDTEFLKNSAYPWLKEVSTFLEKITVKDDSGRRQLAISSSPEINDNRLSAWFLPTTNYDLALMKFNFHAAAELAAALGLNEESAHWKKNYDEFGDFAISPNDELMVSPSMEYHESHRHFSHMMAIHPLGLIKWEDGERERSIISNTLRLLDSIGPANWCGYSYSWLANIKARAKDGNGALKSLQIFAKAFCSANSFHVNGDQTKSGYSTFTYRPFTLEGNFAFAAGLQEMLLQSYAGFIEIMPAVPDDWKDISFRQLRAEGAFLVDAKKAGGEITNVKITSEKGGSTRIKLPFKHYRVAAQKDISIKKTDDSFIELTCKPGGFIVLENKPAVVIR